MTTQRVYIPNKSGHDFSPAEDFGDLVFITEGTLPRFDTNFIYRACIDAMHDAEVDDFLLITSLNIINCVASGILARRFGKINYLLFSKGRYLVRSVLIDGLLSKDEILEE